MHTLQYIAVKAENDDEAFRRVEDTLQNWLGEFENPSGTWYDWFVVGGGRFTDGDPYQSSPNNIISYKDKSEEYLAMVDEMISYRINNFNSYHQNFKDKNVDINAKLDSYDGAMDFSFELYDLSKCIDMLQGKWDFNSHFFDMEADSTNIAYMRKDLDKDPDSWYLVPVDFHF